MLQLTISTSALYKHALTAGAFLRLTCHREVEELQSKQKELERHDEEMVRNNFNKTVLLGVLVAGQVVCYMAGMGKKFYDEGIFTTTKWP